MREYRRRKGGKEREWEMRRWRSAGAGKSRDLSGLETGEIIEKRGQYLGKHSNNKNSLCFFCIVASSQSVHKGN